MGIWKSLQEQARHLTVSGAFHPKANSHTAFSGPIHLDFSAQLITDEIFHLLFKLADEHQLRPKIHALMNGSKVNKNEQRPALHTALRAPDDQVIWVDDENIMRHVVNAREKMLTIAERIRQQDWRGFSGEPIKDVVNIGIGGSDLGPRFCLHAFSDLVTPCLNFHFIPDADPTRFERLVKHLNPETTLFIVSSKSFTTPETLYNAKKAQQWIGHHPKKNRHFIAITACADKAHDFGIDTVLPIWDWVGGRFSVCSAINLITAIAIGRDGFCDMLAGAYDMDQHFLSYDFEHNLPIILALMGIWNINFLSIHNLLLLTYAEKLEPFVPYLQQLDMESNGKSIDLNGQPVTYATGPIVWGGLGNQAQHSYYQLLCQGTHKVAADFITLKSFDDHMINQFSANKRSVLSRGIKEPHNPYGFISGGCPINHICLEDHTPYTIGALLAMYEHKIYTQSVIWHINPFDQPGVEQAKKIFHRQHSGEHA